MRRSRHNSWNHSKIADYRKQLKIRAVQAAKEKGVYLTEAIGEKLGETITINEPYEGSAFTPNQINSYYGNVNGLGVFETLRRDSMATAPVLDVDFKKIKLRYEVNVIFALK